MRSKLVLKNVLTSLILQFVTVICGFIVPKLIIENYGSEINGVIVSVTQFLSYITLLEAGFGPVIKAMLYKPISKKDNRGIQKILKTSDKFFKKIALIFLIYIIGLMIFYPIFVERHLSRLFTMTLILIIAISTFAEYFFGITYMIFLQADQKSYIISYIQIATKVINTIIMIILIYFKIDILLVKLISSLIFVLKPIFQNMYVKKKYNVKLDEINETIEIKQRWDGLAQHIAYAIHSNTDVVVLTILSNITNVSIYSVYSLVINGIRNIIGAFSSGIEATFGDMIAKNEQENLNEKFRIYELIYYCAITIISVSTLILIIPFVNVYTKNFADADYIQPIFAYILVSAEICYSIRRPYNSLILAAGHFKETKKGAWVEAGINLILSIILVRKFGIVGVALGTLVAMIFRTLDFIIYSSKKILKRNITITFIRITILIVNILLVLLINFKFGYNNVSNINNYINWILYAIIIVMISTLVTILFNFIIYFKDVNKLYKRLKKRIDNKKYK